MEIPLWLVGVDVAFATAVYMTLWFGLAVYAKRLDVVEAAWGLGFVYVTALVLMLDGRYETWQWLVFGFVAVWGLRLFLYAAARLQRTGDDRRSQKYQQKYGEKYLNKAYTNTYLLRGLLIIAVATPALAAIMGPDEPILWLMAAGFVVWAVGIVFEAVADAQLQRFIAKKAGRKPEDIMDKGLWKYSRHPNYFGEVVAWTGAAVVAISVGQWWGLIGPVVLTYVLVKVTGVPVVENRYKDSPAYKKYMQKTSMLVPRRPRA